MRTKKFIDVYDGLFDYEYRESLYFKISSMPFYLNGSDKSYGNSARGQIYSGVGPEFLAETKFEDTEAFAFLHRKYNLSGCEITQARINASNSAERNVVHSDNSAVTLLYYANPEWKLEWGGHTLFMDERLNEPKKLCLYKPGRLVMFDGSIPHMIQTPTIFCPTTRFSFVIQYRRK